MRGPAFGGLVCWVLGDVAVLWGLPARAEDKPVVVNYAFADQLGSGIYSVNGRTVQIYNIGTSIFLRRPGPDRLGLSLKLPVSVGFYDFQVEDVVRGFPDFLSTLSLLPALEVDVMAKSGWWLMPVAGAGLGKDFTSGGTSFIYLLEGRSLIAAGLGKWDVRIGNRLCYSGYTADMAQPTDDFLLLESGIDVLRGIGLRLGRREATTSVFTVNYVYALSPQVVHQIPQQSDIRANWEVGFTVGTFPGWRLLGIPLPRVGAGWRFGDGPGAFRIVLGEPFPVRLPTEKEREPRGSESGDAETQ